ncbi:hypothetical protein B296_00020238 [Ensete ventricosum]|uniref:Uncharacterized protein n=1 Tax=Ensete ventricosum TaxID=4639 RepID=A0A426ZYF3_ENSVE|nr:hypothetical protein B296_00020238 [Ensete ventricosum]
MDLHYGSVEVTESKSSQLHLHYGSYVFGSYMNPIRIRIAGEAARVGVGDRANVLQTARDIHVGAIRAAAPGYHRRLESNGGEGDIPMQRFGSGWTLQLQADKAEGI